MTSIEKELIDTGKSLVDNQLAWGTSGNISLRMNDESMLISGSGTKLGELKKDDFVVFDIYTDKKGGERKASKETPMHSGIYKKRKDAKAILHSSPFYTTLVACSNELSIISELFIETMYYLENVSYIDYYHPGSQELGDAVAEQSLNANIIIMKNHGVIVFDDSMPQALMRLETLEMACRMVLEAKKAGIRLTRIPDKVVEDFLENSLYKPRKIHKNK
ncbi:L-fuculose-phosphate aldolase [Lentibacillus halodurans]|uniref:L-fuculose-phosphate aldolase n=1 Tax=Lentibacillus halodurans TaxID=237679 RepID=A0A1I1AFQ9_9BACI|nr:class II aldolase/adducin family protein [Lentibacillus halodurans]SFB36312.1 L-fuculose-phosphate aldolase [Lentibacillus halodurans]